MDVPAFTDHLKSHDAATAPVVAAQAPTYEEAEGELAVAYAHADREFALSRLPVFGAALIFLLFFGAAAALRFQLFFPFFVPLFVGSVVSVIIASAFFFKFLLEG